MKRAALFACVIALTTPAFAEAPSATGGPVTNQADRDGIAARVRGGASCAGCDLFQIDLEPLSLVRAQVIGVMRMVDQGEGDEKIIAVAADDQSVSHIRDISGLPDHFYSELRHFFEEYKRLENKTVRVEEFQDRKSALAFIEKAVQNYANAFSAAT